MVLTAYFATDNKMIACRKSKKLEERIKTEILKAYESGYTHFVSGFDSVADLVFASIVIDLKKTIFGISLEAVLAHKGHLNSKNIAFRRCISHCDIITICSQQDSIECIEKRDAFLRNIKGLKIDLRDAG